MVCSTRYQPALQSLYTGDMSSLWVIAVVSSGLLLSSCANSGSGAPHATLQMRDGTTLSGVVLASSPAEIKILGDDKVTRNIPMSQVRSVDYGDARDRPA